MKPDTQKLTAKQKQWLEKLKERHCPNFAECLLMLGDYFPLLHEFSATAQDAIWHAEGNVAVHTDMVLSALYPLLNEYQISGERRQSLLLAALLHDIAKPLTTKSAKITAKSAKITAKPAKITAKSAKINGEQRIVSPKHEEIGMSYLATRLLELPLSFEVISQVLHLVGTHQQAKLLVVKNKGYAAYLTLALQLHLEDLYLLAIADLQGRVCPDLTQQLELIEEFRLWAEQYELWCSPEQIKANLLQQLPKTLIASQQDYYLGYGIWQLMHNEINQFDATLAKNYQGAQDYGHFYILCGLSGSGKSTWIANHCQGMQVISLDEIRKEINGNRGSQKRRGQMLQLAKERLKQALSTKQNVVWDATNLRTDFRARLIKLGINYGALVTLIVIQSSWTKLVLQNKQRSHQVPLDILIKQAENWQFPTKDEAHQVLYLYCNC